MNRISHCNQLVLETGLDSLISWKECKPNRLYENEFDLISEEFQVEMPGRTPSDG